MITVRDLRKDDILKIDEIYQRQPSIDVPSLNNMIINSTLEETDTQQVLGYGAVKLFAEAIMILDKELPRSVRAQALVEAMRTAIVYSKDAGLEQLFAVAADPSYAKVLMNRYRFIEIPGTLLRLDL